MKHKWKTNDIDRAKHVCPECGEVLYWTLNPDPDDLFFESSCACKDIERWIAYPSTYTIESKTGAG